MKLSKKEIQNILEQGWEGRRAKGDKRKKDHKIACKDWLAKQPGGPCKGKQST
jgi:hypothetical protein